MGKLVLLRHGQSVWNLENRFTGWTDVDLSDHGMAEAHNAGKLLKAGGYQFDEAYTSGLKRAIRALWIVLDEMNLMWIPVYRSWRLQQRLPDKLIQRKQKRSKYAYISLQCPNRNILSASKVMKVA